MDGIAQTILELIREIAIIKNKCGRSIAVGFVFLFLKGMAGLHFNNFLLHEQSI